MKRTGSPLSFRVAIAALTASALLASAPAAVAAGAKPTVSLTEGLTLEPAFSPRTTDYVARCDGAPLSVSVAGAKGWESRIGPGEYSKGDLDAPDEGTSAVVTVRRTSSESAKPRRYFMRCLPDDFPAYDYTRLRNGGADLFTMQLTNAYAAIFNHDGIPLWWYQASGQPDNVEVLRDGTVAFAPVDATAAQSANYEIHNLKGKLLRKVKGAGGDIADIHELLQLANGNFVLGTATSQSGVDTTPYGGQTGATVLGIVIQEVTPKGKVVWSWRSEDHIGLEESGRWWDTIGDQQPHDAVHWNSVDIRGNRVLLSFRHLDAIYALNRKTGKIVWKLGGTETPESLTVSGDPKGPQIFGGQHDARFNEDGTISVFDNRSGLDEAPRAVRYEVDEKAGTAKLVETVADPKVAASICCGSARQDEDGDWLISWGGAATGGTVAAYDEKGRNLFKLTTAGGFPYRALPVDERYADERDLRKAMNSRKG